MAIRYPDLQISMVHTDIGKDFALLDKGKIDVLLTFTLQTPDSKSYDVFELAHPELFAMMRAGHPLDDGEESASLKELGQYPQVMNNEPTSFDLIKDIYNKHGLFPSTGFTSNLSSGAQSIVGVSDCIAARFSRPASNLSPLGDKLVYKKIHEETERPTIIAAKIKTRFTNGRTKRQAFIEVCDELFNTGQMREHFFY
jgi:DNA-binding transcriptional LysR family regulator